MTARFIVADVFDGLATLEDASVDLVLSSPPFLAVRSYLPEGHELKHKEIGSEATPADYLDVLLDVVEACARVLAPHGSLVFELGDTYSGASGWTSAGDDDWSNGAGRMSATGWRSRPEKPTTGGWPLDKSLCGIPTLFAWSLAYGHNLLHPQRHTLPWRIRTLKPWIRTNPPVGALGDKERPATSFIVVATKARDRWFDLDGVRTPLSDSPGNRYERRRHGHPADHGDQPTLTRDYSAGAPPLDWWCHADAVLDAELARKRQTGDQPQAERMTPPGQRPRMVNDVPRNGSVTGAHLRRALQTAGILELDDAIDQSPGGYSGAHYAVWPPELVALLLKEMCPRQVCRECGQPRRRITSTEQQDTGRTTNGRKNVGRKAETATDYPTRTEARVTTLGWSDCGHGNWRNGLVLDPFAGSGTTLAVATGHGYDAIGIDIDSRNADLARQRCGMFLEVEDSHTTPVAITAEPHNPTGTHPRFRAGIRYDNTPPPKKDYGT